LESENFQTPPHPLLKIREPINQTLHKNFQSNLARKFLSRPCMQKGNRIFLNVKPEKSIPVVKKSGNSTRPCSTCFQADLARSTFEQTLHEKF